MRLATVVASILLVAACARPPTTPPPLAPTEFAGDVLGRNERFVVYDPTDGDTLASLALRFLGSAERYWVIADFNRVDRVEARKPLVIPLVPVNASGIRDGEIQTVPILCYHRFGATKGRMIVSPTQFAAQLEWLKQHDYRVVALKDLVAFLNGSLPLPRRAVVITIDDGHESSYAVAMPILKRYGFPATFFVYTDYVGASGALTWAQIGEIARSPLFDVGAHSKTHRNLAVRNDGENDERYRRNIEAEVRVPKELLEKHVDERIRWYAFPYGDTNDIVLGSIAKNGYGLAATVTPGANAFFAHPLLLRRTMIFGEYDLDAFRSRLQTARRVADVRTP